MDIKLYPLVFLILVASSIIPVLLYSNNQQASIETKPININASSAVTENRRGELVDVSITTAAATKSTNRAENVMNKTATKAEKESPNGKLSSEPPVVIPAKYDQVVKKLRVSGKVAEDEKLSPEPPVVIPAKYEQVDKKLRVSGKVDEDGEDFLLLADDEPATFSELADKNDPKSPGHIADPSKKKNLTIVPIAVTEELEPFRFTSLASAVPDRVEIIPFNFEDHVSVMSPDLAQEHLALDWFALKDSKAHAKGRPLDLDDSEELLFDFSPIFGKEVMPLSLRWPKILGSSPNFGPYQRKIKPEVIINPPSGKAAVKVLKIERNLTLKAMCMFSDECISRCCLRPSTENEPRHCHLLSSKDEPCAIGQLKGGVYYGNCPCLSGDAHCKKVGDKETCDA